MRGTDSVGKNWFFIKHDKNSKFTILPWDMDRTWGRSIFRDEMPYTKIITNGLFTRLVENNPSQFNQRVKTRWNELRKTTFSEATLFGLFGDSFDVLTRYRAESLENNLWDADLDINEERMYIETWTKNRLDFLDGHFSI
jgi:spore coat protein CotH